VARISRKELKKDEFVQEVSQTVAYVQEHRSQATVAFAVLGVVVVLVVGGYFLWDKRSSDASDSLSRAQRTYHAGVVPTGTPTPPGSNEKTFPSDKEKNTAALKEFQAIADKYSLLRQGSVARYYTAMCQIALGNSAEGEKELAALADGRDGEVGSLARYALAGAQGAAGKNEEAEKNFRYLMEHPTSAVGKAAAQMALASLLRPIKPAEAEKLYREMESQQVSPKLAEMAKRVLAEMKQ
jgi:hypothetical protein